MDRPHIINSRVSEWQQKADRHQNYQKTNPYLGIYGDNFTMKSDQEEQNKDHTINSRLTQWQEKAQSNQIFMKKSSVLSKNFQGPHYQHLGSREDDENYGRPVQGSKTEFRGKAAEVHISSEVVELCSVIRDMATTLPDGTVAVPFGELFELYTRISNKVVGILMRARRQGLVTFEGEMLYQRRDDHVLIRLLKMPDDLMSEIEKQKDELKHHPSAKSLK